MLSEIVIVFAAAVKALFDGDGYVGLDGVLKYTCFPIFPTDPKARRSLASRPRDVLMLIYRSIWPLHSLGVRDLPRAL